MTAYELKWILIATVIGGLVVLLLTRIGRVVSRAGLDPATERASATFGEVIERELHLRPIPSRMWWLLERDDRHLFVRFHQQPGHVSMNWSDALDDGALEWAHEHAAPASFYERIPTAEWRRGDDGRWRIDRETQVDPDLPAALEPLVQRITAREVIAVSATFPEVEVELSAPSPDAAAQLVIELVEPTAQLHVAVMERYRPWKQEQLRRLEQPAAAREQRDAVWKRRARAGRSSEGMSPHAARGASRRRRPSCRVVVSPGAGQALASSLTGAR